MKNMKKLFAMALAVMMVLTLATTAFADEPTYTLTLNKAQEGHTYTAYQIFTGDLNDSTLSNIVWGNGVTDDGKTALGDAAAKAESLEDVADAEAFAVAVAPYLTGGTASSAVSGGTCTISGLTAGYYLVKTTATSATNNVYTYYIMKVVKDISANIKADVPEVDKEPEVTDANIGDTVTFTLTATMPNTLEGYETYKVIFHDTMSKGLTYANNLKVTIDGNEVTEGFTSSAVVDEGTKVTAITVSFADVKGLGAKASSKIVVTYDAVVNSEAVIGTEGNPNKVYLEYSNNPNAGGEGETGKTPEDEVKVYTWQIPVFKYYKDGEEEKPLAGAGFTLYTDADCTKAVNVVAAGTNVAGDLIFKVCTKEDSPATHTHVNEIVTGTTGKFEIEGLEKGTYYLKETTVPAGYNSVANVAVVIDNDGVLTIGGSNVDTVKVLNQAGSTLPETGGMGTTLFYLFGSIMAMGAAVLLVTKKRMAA